MKCFNRVFMPISYVWYKCSIGVCFKRAHGFVPNSIKETVIWYILIYWVWPASSLLPLVYCNRPAQAQSGLSMQLLNRFSINISIYIYTNHLLSAKEFSISTSNYQTKSQLFPIYFELLKKISDISLSYKNFRFPDENCLRHKYTRRLGFCRRR